ncbi:hypothetical protein F5Y07DRAFT_369845 [Xylaria sp. FL0933]|nr:hypothetical protein F5Y07DRAFT_369845 [Xylaria sp. FL0933]
MAYLQAALVVAKTLYYFDFQESSTESGDWGSLKFSERGHMKRGKEEYRLSDIIVATHNGPWLKFFPRNVAHTELGTSCDIGAS